MGLFTNRKSEEGDLAVAGLTDAASMLASFGPGAPADLDGGHASPEAAPARRLEDRPRERAGNVEIDANGLLTMLGVGHDAPLDEISAACQRFLADHVPAADDDPDAAAIKRKIRRQVNIAYASFRLTHAD